MGEEPEMAGSVKDPVCGVELRPEDAVATEDHDGRKLYFHSEECHRTYLNDPHRYGHGEREEDPGTGEE